MPEDSDLPDLAIDEGVVDEDEENEAQIDEYQISASPNDFNVLTIASFMEKGSIRIPGFQRHFVWDIKRSSKLIESIILGLPIPQVFLYEEDQNTFLVIDGQQRLMSIYFFVRQRFPKKTWRAELRNVFNTEGRIPEEILMDDNLFQNFNLSLARLPDGSKNRFHGLNYSTLGHYRNSFDLRTIRNVIVRQLQPQGDDSSIYEMFNRLNSGGMNLRPQEIRASMYHSGFFDLLFQQNLRAEWRRLLGTDIPDLHMRDIEILLRAIALYEESSTYRPSMTTFLNKYCKEARHFDTSHLSAIDERFNWFFNAARLLDNAMFRTRSGFSVLLMESVFSAAVNSRTGPADNRTVAPETVRALREDADYRRFTEVKTNDTVNVRGRLQRAASIVQLV